MSFISALEKQASLYGPATKALKTGLKTWAGGGALAGGAIGAVGGAQSDAEGKGGGVGGALKGALGGALIGSGVGTGAKAMAAGSRVAKHSRTMNTMFAKSKDPAKFAKRWERHGAVKTAGLGALNPLNVVTSPLAATEKAKESSKTVAEAAGSLAADAKKARKHNLAQYLLNPHVPGPLTEAVLRLQRRHHASKSEHPYRTSLIPGYGEIRGGEAGKKELAKHGGDKTASLDKEAVSASLGDQLTALQKAQKKAKHVRLLKGGLLGAGVLGAAGAAHHALKKKS